MPVAFDATSGAYFSGDGEETSFSWAHTCSGDRRALVVGLAGQGVTLAPSVTYQGQVMPQAASALLTGSAHRIGLYYRAAPPPGAGLITVTFPALPAPLWVGTAASYTGVDQVTPLRAAGGGKFANNTQALIPLAGPVGAQIVTLLGVEATAASTVTDAGDQVERQNRKLFGLTEGIHGALGDVAGGPAPAALWAFSERLAWGALYAVVYPAGWPYLYPTHIQVTQTVTSEATGAVYPRWTVTGPGYYLILENRTYGATFRLPLEIRRGETVVIDMAPTRRTVVGSIQGDLGGQVAAGSTFWSLAPGGNELFLELGQTLPETAITLERTLR
jgi:hypothetical protein